MLMENLNFIFSIFQFKRKGRIQKKSRSTSGSRMVRLQTELGFILHNNYVISLIFCDSTLNEEMEIFNCRLNSFYQQAWQECQFISIKQRVVGFW